MKLGAVELKGMALGTFVAVGLSLLFALFDRLGWTRERGQVLILYYRSYS